METRYKCGCLTCFVYVIITSIHSKLQYSVASYGSLKNFYCWRQRYLQMLLKLRFYILNTNIQILTYKCFLIIVYFFTCSKMFIRFLSTTTLVLAGKLLLYLLFWKNLFIIYFFKNKNSYVGEVIILYLRVLYYRYTHACVTVYPLSNSWLLHSFIERLRPTYFTKS